MKRTPAAVLRAILEIKDGEMAERLGCSRYTIHSLESGRLPMSEGMAVRMQHETGISSAWLLAGDAKARPQSVTGTPFIKADFDRAQASKAFRDRPPDSWLLDDALDLSARLVAILVSASKRQQYQLAIYKAMTAIIALGNEFGQDRALYPNTRFGHMRREQAVAIMKALCKKRAPVDNSAVPAAEAPEYDDIWATRRVKRKGV